MADPNGPPTASRPPPRHFVRFLFVFMLVPESVVAFVVPVFISPCLCSLLVLSVSVFGLFKLVALCLWRSMWLQLWLRLWLLLWFRCGSLCLRTEQARAVEVSGVRRDAFGRMMPRPRGNFGRYCPGQPGAGIPVEKLNILALGLGRGQGGRMLSTTLIGDRFYPALLSSMGRDLAVAPDSMLLKIHIL